MSFKNAVALTGGIATGKSSVCSLLNLYGFKIIDADKIAHKLLQFSKDKISEVFGNEYIKDGIVDRKMLGALIFSDRDKRLMLEAILHPLIKEEIKSEASFCESKGVPYIVDIPLFFENRNYNIGEVVLVYATREQQLHRLISREGLSLSEAEQRVDAQMCIESKKSIAPYIIDNTKDLKHLQREVDRFVEYLKVKQKSNQL